MCASYQSVRHLKVSRQIQKDLSEILCLHNAEFCLGRMVSVTAVRISSDMHRAKVYLSIFPFNDAQCVMRSINDYNARIRHHLGLLIGGSLRIVPDLIFELDDSLNYIENIDRLLDHFQHDDED